MKRKRASSKNDENIVQIGELSFEKRHAGADYNRRCKSDLTDRELINGTACLESTIVFAAREGQIITKSPKCEKVECCGKICTSRMRVKKRKTKKGASVYYY